MKKFAQSVAGASIFIAFFGFISRGLGFFREVIFASFFGLSEDFDIYLIGAVLPLTINIIILTFGQNYIIPNYSRIKQNDQSLSQNFIKTNFYFFIFSGILLAFLLYLLSDIILTLYLQQSNSLTKQTAINIFNLFLITIPFNCGISVINAYQQSNFEFRYSIVSQLLPNIFVLLSLLILSELNIYVIPIGFIVGSIAQLIFLLSKSPEVLFVKTKIIYSLNQFKEIVSGGFIIVILIESIGQLYVISDRYFYNFINPGGISALNFAQILFLLPVSIITMALSTAVFPKFSLLFNEKKNTELKEIINQGIVVSVVVFIPVMFLFLFYGGNIITLLYERGRFSVNDTFITSQVLFYYALSIVLYAAYGILNKLMYSIGMIKKLLLITLLGIVLKILLNFFLVEKMQQNGLALSTSISYSFFFLAAIITIYRETELIKINQIATEIIFNLSNAVISYYITNQFLSISQIFKNSQYFGPIIFLSIFTLNIFVLETSSAIIIHRLSTKFKFLTKDGNATE